MTSLVYTPEGRLMLIAKTVAPGALPMKLPSGVVPGRGPVDVDREDVRARRDTDEFAIGAVTGCNAGDHCPVADGVVERSRLSVELHLRQARRAARPTGG